MKTLGTCNTPKCGEPATVVNEFPDGERYEWCARCAAEIQEQVREVKDLVATAREIERSLMNAGATS